MTNLTPTDQQKKVLVYDQGLPMTHKIKVYLWENRFLNLFKSPLLLMFFLGLVTSFGQERYGWVLAGVAGLFFAIKFLVQSQNQSQIRLCLLVFLYFFGYLGGGLYWFAYSTHAELDQFWWVIPFAALGLPAFLALFYTPLGMLLSRLKGYGVGVRVLSTVLFISFVDFVRSYIFTGLPWLLFGQMGDGAFLVDMAPLYALGGVHFVGLYFLLAVGFLVIGALHKQSKIKMFLNLGAVVILSQIPAFMRPFEAKLFPVQENTSTQPLDLVMVQPDIAQREKWDPAYISRNLRILMELSKAPRQQGSQQKEHDHPAIESTRKSQDQVQEKLFSVRKSRYYIWPEAALPSVLHQDQAYFYSRITSFMAPGDYLLTGTPRYFLNDEGARIYRNSLVILNAKGEQVFGYDKRHLVPFGEYVPLRSIFGNVIEPFVPGRQDYSPGHEQEENNGLNQYQNPLPGVVPLICYEAIFGNEVRAHVLAKKQPTFLLNLTNDGWFLDSSGPFQHLHISKIRAVELGLPLVRVAWRGVSAYVNYHGQELARIDYGVAEALEVQVDFKRRETFYLRFGEYIYFGVFAFLLIIVLGLSVRHKT